MQMYMRMIVVAAGMMMGTLEVSAQQIDKGKIDALVKPLIEDQGFVGVAVGVVTEQDQLVCGYGVMSKESGKVPDGQTLFEIGSVSKVFTGTLLGQAVLEGKLQLSDPIQTKLKSVTVPQKGPRQMTFVDLATHTSGLPRMPSNFSKSKPTLGNPFANYDVEHLYDFLNGTIPVYETQQTYQYSNVGTGLLGHLMEQVHGAGYESLVVSRIAKPLGMTSTKLTLDTSDQSRLATGHVAAGQATANWDFKVLAGAGAIRSNVDDMLIFLRANIGLTDSSLSDVFELCHTIHYSKDDQPSVGLGWHRLRAGWSSEDIIWHNGMTGGYATFTGFTKKNNRGVVVLSNTAKPVDQLALQILRALEVGT